MVKMEELRKQISITQEECRKLFDPPIPARTWSDYARGLRKPAPWVEGLICQRLMEEIEKIKER